MGLPFRPVEREEVTNDAILGLHAGADGSVVSRVTFYFPSTMLRCPDPIQGSPTNQVLLYYAWKNIQNWAFLPCLIPCLHAYFTFSPGISNVQRLHINTDSVDAKSGLLWAKCHIYPNVLRKRSPRSSRVTKASVCTCAYCSLQSILEKMGDSGQSTSAAVL